MVRIVQHGSCKPILQAEALATFLICISSHIHIELEWVPKEQNQIADYYSRLIDYDDYRLNSVIFEWLSSLYTVDRFCQYPYTQIT